jgi:hypothetical protein
MMKLLTRRMQAAACKSNQVKSLSEQKEVIDAGFILTKPIHSYLARHRDVNDVLAFENSMFLTATLAYVVYVTLWKGDFQL